VFPGWLTGALVTLYLFLPTLVHPTAHFASERSVTRMIVVGILLGFGALLGFALAALKQRLRRD
jgi:hypothetical protein